MIVANQQHVVLQKNNTSESKVIPLKITEPQVGISILIPIFNYDAYKLVETLHTYYLDERLDIEIICCDDGSSSFLEENKKLNDLAYCTYYRSKKNKGRAQTRNFLAQKAQKDYILFLDCDVLPKNVSFLQRYYNSVNEGHDIIFGGLDYSPNITRSQNLRWLFGIYREATPLEKRIKKPYENSFTSNILIKRNIFNTIQFESSITNYGYEDVLFIKNLERQQYNIHQIANEVYHLHVDKSADYLDKVKIAMKNLIYLDEANLLDVRSAKLSKVHNKLNNVKLTFLMRWFYLMFNRPMEKKLVSDSPSLFVFDVYKLSYYCYLKNKRNKYIKKKH